MDRGPRAASPERRYVLEELKKQVHAAILERLSALAIRTLTIEPYARAFLRGLLDKHHYRKHGERACYGQERGTD